MKPDQLIRGNIYLYLDEDDQGRRCLYDRTVTLPNHTCGFRFRIEGIGQKGYCRNLTSEEVKNRIFRSPNVPQ